METTRTSAVASVVCGDSNASPRHWRPLLTTLKPAVPQLLGALPPVRLSAICRSLYVWTLQVTGEATSERVGVAAAVANPGFRVKIESEVEGTGSVDRRPGQKKR